MQQNYNKKRKLNKLKASLLLLMMVCFALPAEAQQNNVFMKDGTFTIQRNTGVINFYDSHGPAQQTNYWETWYNHNESYTYVFKPAIPGDKIKVTFNAFTAYAENPNNSNDPNGVNIGSWVLRLNDDYLNVYQGNGVVEANKIATFSGNSQEVFSVMSDGAITFQFTSNGQFREEGWFANVVLVQGDMAPQAPFIQRSTCSDMVEILPTTLGAKIYYSLDGNDPAPGDPLGPNTYDYSVTGPISFPEGVIPDAGFTVKAVSTLPDGTTPSAVNTVVFKESDRVPIPGPASITREEGTNTIIMTPATRPAGLNDTYQVRYTVGTSTNPPANPNAQSTLYTGPITCTQSGTVYKARTVAMSCSNQMSTVDDIVTYTVNGIYAPTPIIDFDAMTITAKEGATNFDILYTTDGTMPSVDPITGTYSDTQVNLSNLSPGQTVRALAYRANNDSGHTANSDYYPSQVVTAIYVPSSGSGIYNNNTVVLLDDREDHTWAYYSNTDSPIKSLNPADVKITYYGNGITMTSNDYTAGSAAYVTASGVKVGVDADANQFIYLKTLERTDGATSNDPSGRCEYTTIPNPFSVRPVYANDNTTRYRGFQCWRLKSVIGGGIYTAETGGNALNTGAIINAEQIYYFAPTTETGMEVELEAVWARAYVATSNGATLNGGSVERNFFVITSNDSDLNSYKQNVPCTYTSLYPNGTTNGTTPAALSDRRRAYSTLDPNNHCKIEYIILRNNTSTIHAKGYDLIIGRGVTGYNNGVCATYIYGLNSATPSGDFRVRIESGRYTCARLLNSSDVTSAFTLNATFGCDYDRASKTNSNLTFTGQVNNNGANIGAVNVGYSSHCTNANTKINVYALSGTFGSNAEDLEFYVGFQNVGNSTNSVAYRKLEVLGGEFLSGIAGGIERGVGATTPIVEMRIKGGTVHRYLYGCGQYAAAYGVRKTIITGGTFDAWIAGGCYGTGNSSSQTGATNGDAYVYFGGKASQTNTDGIFGAGYGNYNTNTGYYTINKSFIVVADDATTTGSVYGGGNNGYNTSDAKVYVLGGGKNGLTVSGSVYGGANKARSAATTTVTMENGTVNGSVYGGANTSGAVAQLATVNVSGGTVKGSVYGGGKGSGTTMSNNTKVTVTGGTINTNIYGGGEEGAVSGNTLVSFEGGSVTDIYGAGKGSSNQRANVAQGTTVNVKGGVVNGAVYGGGEDGTVAYSSNGNSSNYGSTVSISGGEVKGDVFGGGKMGTTQGATTVNITGAMDNPLLRQNVFAGAYGAHGSIYVAGLKTLNITGGRIYGSVYGGSRNANDGPTLNTTSGNTATSVTNISGGRIDQHVYAAGYYGQTFGSVYAFIGISAIENAPNHSMTSGFTYNKNSLIIGGTVWAGGDWGVFSGSFGASTVTGNSNIYINGEGYSTDGNDQSATNYMNIAGSIMGCGTSCDAGSGERTLILSHYGADIDNSGTDSDVNPFAYASRDVNSIQRFHNVIFDDAKLGFIGQGKINSMNSTEKFALYEIDQNVYLGNGSTMVMNVPSSQIYSFHSVTINNAYATSPTFTPVVYNGLGTTGGETDNKIRVNGGSYIEIKYVPEESSSSGGETLTYDFEDGSMPDGWTSEGNNSWSVGTGDNGTDVGAHGGSYNAKITHGTTGNVTYLVLPEMDYSNTTEASISLWYINRRTNGWGQRYYDNFAICYRVNNGNWIELSSTTNYHTNWTEMNVSLPELADHYQIGFRFTDNNGRGVGIDDITITQPVAPSGGGVVYPKAYGELSGFAHMMAGNPSNDATCAYARTKQSKETGNILPSSASDYFNTDDGGFVSYRAKDNQYDIDGNYYLGGGKDQLRYENHYPDMRENSEYYRIWRHGGNRHFVEAVVTAEAAGTSGAFKAVEVEVQLPSWGKAGSYYRFDRTGSNNAYNTLIDYGEHVLTFNGANYADELTDNTWMYYDGEAQQSGVGQSNATVSAALTSIRQTPNLNFGLVVLPGQTMKSTDANYIITSEADAFLASTEKPFNCDDNTHMPTIKLRLTYSDELSANATLDAVQIPLVQCGPDGTITDYVTISLIINTKASITSGFTTQVYARMDGSTNTREVAQATVVLPAFTVHNGGEEAKFYLKKVDFIQNDGVALGSGHTTVTYAEKADNTNLNIDRFAMTIEAQANPDNIEDWNFNQGPQDGVRPGTYPNYNSLVWGGSNDRGVFLGQAKGRFPLSFGIKLIYNSNESVTAQTKMGDVKFTIEFTNYENGDPNNEYRTTFTVTAEVYRIGPGRNFYVDGVNGVDATDANRAKYPDLPARSINYIFNRLGYLPGDNIFVVNQLPISKATTWDGGKYSNNVNIYRYPGGHKLSTGEVTSQSFPNEPYLGALVDVTKELTMKGIMMDGMYAEATAPVGGVHNTTLYPIEGSNLGVCTFDGTADAPLITVSNGGRLNLTDGTVMQNNYNSSSNVSTGGGAVNVAYGGILAMNVDTRMTGNINANGGAVYMDGSMIVSDYVYIYDNYKAAVASKAGEGEQNNVMLAPVVQGTFRVVQLGTADADAYGALLKTDANGETKIGVNKEDWNHGYDGYMPVVYAEAGSLNYLNDPYNTQSMVVHDGNIYKLERYTSTEYPNSPRYLYWLGTWVTAVTWNPYFESREDEGYTNNFTAAQLADIHTPQQLAWAISLVNGENGCTAAPNTNFTLTDDIDMKANIWVPIGNETNLYNGTFEGNGHVVTGLRGSISRTDMGMFGRTNANAKIQNMVVSTEFNTSAENLGTVVGNMMGGTLSNVEGAGENTNKFASGNNGGLVGTNGGVIHSSFAVTTIKGGNNMGGLVAVNDGDLINSFSAAVISDGTSMAGLVAINDGRVENCYDATNADVAFAIENNGSIKFCYTPEVEEGETVTYVKSSGDEAVLKGHGTYGGVQSNIKHLDYMYRDNLVDPVTAVDNDYANHENHEYLNKHTVVWNGLLSVLNQWVADGSVQGKPSGLSTWNRPLTKNLNGDLPILAFPKDNCVGNLAAEDGKMLRYSASDAIVVVNNEATQAHNGLDHLLGEIYDQKAANIYLYGNAINVVSGTASNKLFIHEDAALLQKATNGTMPDISATVGVTFDNSCKTAVDHFNHTLVYDWHFMSSALQDAPINATFGDPQGFMHDVNITGMDANCYFPNGLPMTAGNTTGVQWDFYTYSEKHYHWINLKRNDHFYQESGQTLSYANETSFVPGKGYMMAISQDSYMNSTGKLNNANVPIAITSQEPLSPEYNKGWNLVGNPYQAYLDLQALLDDTDNKDNATQAYVYDADEKAYVPFVKKASDNPRILQRYVHQHQGFFVHSEKDNATLTFKPSMATATIAEGYTAPYYRGDDDRINYPLVNLFAENANGGRDLAVIEFNRPELGGVTKVNGLRNANFQLAASLEGHRYGLVFTPEGTERVPVHFTTEENGTFTLTWETMHGNFTSLLLVDNMTGTITDMLRADHYTFDASKDDYASRFYLTYTVTDVDEYNEGDGSFAFFDGSEWVVNGKGQLDIVDVTGRVLFSKRLANERNRVSLNGVANGVYLMRVTDGKNTMVQKIVVK